MKKIKLTGKYNNGLEAIVDDEDFERCILKSWYVSTRGRPKSMHKIGGKWKQVFMHRFIMDFPKSQIDHKNRNPLDNRKKNLRLCTRGENTINNPPISGKRFKGVRSKNGGWEARIKVNRKDIYLGMFKKAKDAALAYNNAAKKHFGKFAWLNPI